MDNLTHSLAGALIGDATCDLKQSKNRSLLVTASIIANNFPDIDGVYTRIMPPPLGYLLHHRGHTHTLLGLIPQALLIYGLLLLFPTFRKQLQDRSTKKLTFALIAIGLCVHMLLDSWNSYGIHPFYPFSSKWFYGDLIFIVEPFIWFAFAAPLFFMWRSRYAKGILAVAITTIPLLAAFNNLLTWYSVAAALSFGLLTSFFVQRAKTKFKKSIVGVIAAVSFICLQAFSAMRVRENLRAEFKPNSPNHKILDFVLSPLPANPFCWSVIQLEVDRDQGEYISVGKTISAFPSVLSPEACVEFRSAHRYSTTSLSTIKDLVQRDCYVNAWLRFARAPYFDSTEVSDLRFNQRAQNFSSLETPPGNRDCPKFIPPWDYPRADLLEEANSR